MTFGGESATRYAANTTSGATFSFMSDIDRLVNQLANQSSLFGQPDAHHGHQDDTDRAEIQEVPHCRREEKADAIRTQQTLDGGCYVFKVVGLRIDALIGDTGAEHREHLGEQDHHAREHKKNHGRMGDLVADLFNPVQECLQKCPGLWLG